MWSIYANAWCYQHLLVHSCYGRKLCTFLSDCNLFRSCWIYSGILMSRHWTCYKFQPIASTDREPLSEPCIERSVLSSVQLRELYFRQRIKEVQSAKWRNNMKKKTWKTWNNLVLVIDAFATPLFIYFSSPVFRKSEHSWCSDAIKLSCRNGLFHFTSRRYYLLRSHIIFYGALVIVQYYCFLPSRKLTAT